MDGYTFLERVGGILAWPLVFALVIVTQQKAIAELIRRATKFRFKWGKAELLFEEGVKRIDQTVKVVEKQQELEVVEPRALERPAIAAPEPIPVPAEETRSHERLEEFTGTGWVWSLGAWANAGGACTTRIPPGLPTDAQITVNGTGCDDTVNVVPTGTYTATSTWNRSPDGRGPDLQTFLTKRIQRWTYNGLQWNPVFPTTDTNVNLGMNPAHWCM